MASRVCLAVIRSADKALHYLGTFAFVVLRLFFTGRRHFSAVVELLRLVERLEEIHTEVQGVISSPELSISLLYDVSRRWIQYFNRCMAASSSEVVEAPSSRVSFSLKPILVKLYGG